MPYLEHSGVESTIAEVLWLLKLIAGVFLGNDKYGTRSADSSLKPEIVAAPLKEV